MYDVIAMVHVGKGCSSAVVAVAVDVNRSLSFEGNRCGEVIMNICGDSNRL